MPYVSRDANGNIIAIFRSPTDKAAEELAADDPEVVSFLSAPGSGEQALKWELFISDMAMGRLTEDLIDALIEKNVIAFTDLPEATQTKLLRRRKLREKLQSVEALMGDQGGVL
jgi:hypothetical protein